MSTGIEWCQEVWNPLAGCSKVSQGCKHCYAEVMAKRLVAMGQQKYAGTVDAHGRWTGKINLDEAALSIPLRWKKPRVIFVNSMSDLFHEAVPDAFIDTVFAVMALASQHTFVVLTKRADWMGEYFSSMTNHSGIDALKLRAEIWTHTRAKEIGMTMRGATFTKLCHTIELRDKASTFGTHLQFNSVPWPLPNFVLGVSVENQAAADERIPHLLRTPAACRVISAEPLLGPLKLRGINVSGYPAAWKSDVWVYIDCLNGERSSYIHGVKTVDATNKVDGIIVGGESGRGARPMHPEWVRGIRDQCVAAGVKFFFKQWGEWAPLRWRHHMPAKGDVWLHVDGTTIQVLEHEMPSNIEGWALMRRLGKRESGRWLDDRAWDELPWNGTVKSER